MSALIAAECCLLQCTRLCSCCVRGFVWLHRVAGAAPYMLSPLAATAQTIHIAAEGQVCMCLRFSFAGCLHVRVRLPGLCGCCVPSRLFCRLPYPRNASAAHSIQIVLALCDTGAAIAGGRTGRRQPPVRRQGLRLTISTISPLRFDCGAGVVLAWLRGFDAALRRFSLLFAQSRALLASVCACGSSRRERWQPRRANASSRSAARPLPVSCRSPAPALSPGFARRVASVSHVASARFDPFVLLLNYCTAVLQMRRAVLRARSRSSPARCFLASVGGWRPWSTAEFVGLEACLRGSVA